VGEARALGTALAALLLASGPAVAPLLPAPRAAVPCPERTRLEISLDCPPASQPWLAASLLAPDPFASDVSDPIARSALQLPGDRLATIDFASVPEPTALLALGLGLAGFAALRRTTGARYSG
jgi:hypothetical protein